MTDEDKSLDLATSSIPEPAVGIFWGIRDRQGTTQLVLASVPLAEAEAYGDCLGFARSHLDVWTAWQRRGATILARQGFPPAIARHGYEHFPRGRVVYGTNEAAFTIYADRKLQTPEVLDQIVRRFGLGQQRVAIRSDAHYRTGPD